MIKVQKVKENLLFVDNYFRHYPCDLQIMKLEHLERILESCLGIVFAVEVEFSYLQESVLPTLLSCCCPVMFSYLRWFCVLV